MTMTAMALKARKSPVQARSAATIEALHTATIQVLTREGLSRCTTTRIADPNRDALLAAVLEMHLTGVSSAVERACREYGGRPVAEMASGLVTAFLAIKLRNPAESKALYAVAAERGGAELVARLNTRVVAAITAMLASAPDAHFDDPSMAAAIAMSAIGGAVRSILDGYAPLEFEANLERQLILLVTAYLQAHRLRT
jgi:AcrR family transcriptional regulator